MKRPDATQAFLTHRKIQDFCRKFRKEHGIPAGSCMGADQVVCPFHNSQNTDNPAVFMCSDKFADAHPDRIDEILAASGYEGLENERIEILKDRVHRYCDRFLASTSYGECKGFCPFSWNLKCTDAYVTHHPDEVEAILAANGG